MDSPTPKKTPISPPKTLSTMASVRNWSRMSFCRAPDGHADADLPDALGHRDEHDVHDADPADEQRDRGDAAQQDGHDLGRLGRALGDLGHVPHLEVVLGAPGAILCRIRSSSSICVWASFVRAADTAEMSIEEM